MKKPQATKATRSQVDLHIERQRALGEGLIDDTDDPTVLDLIVTAMFVLTVLAGWAMGWL
jgi:hypothetical protein